MLLAKHPSLELSWLPLSDRKTMPTPAVAFMDLDWCSACYLRRGDRHENLESTGATDTIILSTHWGGDIRPSCIAHEYRHMQQHYLPDLPKATAEGMLQLENSLIDSSHDSRVSPKSTGLCRGNLMRCATSYGLAEINRTRSRGRRRLESTRRNAPTLSDRGAPESTTSAPWILGAKELGDEQHRGALFALNQQLAP
jgi:hypothetical protein